MDDIKDSDHMKKDFGYLRKTLGGYRPFELTIKVTIPH